MLTMIEVYVVECWKGQFLEFEWLRCWPMGKSSTSSICNLVLTWVYLI